MKRSLLCWVFAAISVLALQAAAAQTPDYREDIERQLFADLNQERTKRGLSELKWNDMLRDSAHKHSERMASAGTLSHQLNGEHVLMQRVAATGLHFNAVAENIGVATDADDLHPGWMRSEGHRANILNPKYTAVGIGVVKTGRYYYATQNFAHTEQDFSSADAETAFAKAVNEYRAQRHLSPIAFTPSDVLRSALCSMSRQDKLSPESVQTTTAKRSATVFTTSDPEQVPEHLYPKLSDPTLSAITVGACFGVTPAFAGGSYWIGIGY